LVDVDWIVNMFLLLICSSHWWDFMFARIVVGVFYVFARKILDIFLSKILSDLFVDRLYSWGKMQTKRVAFSSFDQVRSFLKGKITRMAAFVATVSKKPQPRRLAGCKHGFIHVVMKRKLRLQCIEVDNKLVLSSVTVLTAVQVRVVCSAGFH